MPCLLSMILTTEALVFTVYVFLPSAVLDSIVMLITMTMTMIISKVYMSNVFRISLPDIAAKLQLDSSEDAEYIVSKVCECLY